MDQRLRTTLQAVGSMNKQEAATALVSAVRAVGVWHHALRTARDRFNAILTQARKGTPQLIGLKSESMTVGMSLSDLVDMVQAAAQKQSFGDALDAAGFKPISGKTIAVREGFPAEPLVWRRFKGSASE